MPTPVPHEQPAQLTGHVDLLLRPARPGGGRAAAGAALRPDGPGAVRVPVLLLVPARADPVRGRAHRDRLLPRRRARTAATGRPVRRCEPMSDVSTVAFSVFIFLFLLVTVLGFAAARWRRAQDLDNLDEWGLGGRGFGTFIAWFLIGGDLYTAYTFIAVPALLYAGSGIGFFAVPYTIVVYPMIFLFLPRLWSVSHRHGYVTPADFVAGPLRQPGAGAGGRVHRHPRDDALHRAAAGRHRGGPRGDGHRRRGGQLVRQPPAAVHRVRGARGLHLLVGPPGAGADRVRQGHPDLHRDLRRGHLPADPARRLGQHLQRRPATRSTPSTPRTPTRSRPARRARGA